MARRQRDGKAQALSRSRTLNLRPEAVSDEAFAESEFFDARDVVQVKYEMVRRAHRHPVGLDAGLEGLVPAKPGPRGAHKLTVEVLDHLERLRAADPELRAAELAEAVAERFGVRVHPRSVERALARREAAARSTKSG